MTAGDFAHILARMHDLSRGTPALRLDATGGWLEGVRRVPSPNCDDRPPGTDIELIVLHGISLPPREYGGPYIDQLFTNTLDPEAHPYFRGIAALRVSAHVLVDRAGRITQYVPFTRRAWHAGQSAFCGRTACNDFSIGIELEGCDDEPYEPAQYGTAADLVRLLMSHWPRITPGNIVGHSDVAPGRKTDPGPAFDWHRFRGLLAARLQ